MTTAQDQQDQIVGKQKLDPKKIKREVLVRALEIQTQTTYGDDAPDDATIVAMLSAYYSKIPQDNLVQCSDCDGWSDANLDGCPFCGAKDNDSVVETASAKTSDPVVETTPPKKGSVKKASAKKPAKEPPHKNGANGTTALATTAPSAVVVHSEKDLDAAVLRVGALKGEGAHALWQLGRELLDIFTKELWRQRNGDDGKPKYKGFHQFVELECQISKTHAYAWMRISKDYAEADVRKFGQENLAKVITVPKDQQPELLALLQGQGKDGRRLTTREVREEAKKIRERTGAVGGKGRTAAATAAAAKPRRPTVTCMVFEGKQSVKLFTKETAKLADEDKRKRAKKVGDKPVGVLACSNGVVLKLSVQEDASGALIVAVEAVRKKDE